MKNLKFLVRYYFTVILFLLKYTPFQKEQNKNLINIINFHYFIKKGKLASDPSLETNFDIFEKQMQILSKFHKFIHNVKEIDSFFNLSKKKIILIKKFY